MEQSVSEARTLVLVDPSSAQGEGGVGMLTTDDRAVSLLLTLHGPTAAALHEYAACERIDVSMAGLIYLDQVVSRAVLFTDDVETIATVGSDVLAEIFSVLAQRNVDKVIVPSDLAGLERRGLAELIRLCPVPVVVAPVEAPRTAVSMAS